MHKDNRLSPDKYDPSLYVADVRIRRIEDKVEGTVISKDVMKNARGFSVYKVKVRWDDKQVSVRDPYWLFQHTDII